ncbi:MAG: LytTR family transcriptional regulator DNA-binding domain-containing protein [Flavobacteriales bacterium]|nr:LytTR family transcriptional regulator DNA-binding domain-containing protein [Flavobacteriales bacterium]MCW8911928.1 LytTR family transcriptional regulator DNA-binding domain-containing protein [Flavobacteriales bacterium]MCW8937582.1 LytTR family transcriptional regulator DNA-binding domain-containing protein [Flavobacteriales bacterium]MCW8940920.1 LytTR family transcriptional regulator DNA-binding domain-containing protein [Flavobacteriales bacterium]MCW8968594.1 LytTR family transcripti
MTDFLNNIQNARIHIKELQEAIDNNLQKICLLESQVQELLKIRQSSTIPIKGISKINFVPINQIQYFKANQSYTNVITERHNIILATKSIREFEALLDDYFFFKINKSVLINTHKIHSFSKKSNQIIMNNNDSFEISRRRKCEFLSVIDRILK